MSKYTIELRQIKDLRNTIFNFDYNFISQEYKNKLETMFINHFYFREIGFETIERFNFYLRNIFTEKLEYYEKLLELSKLDYDILCNYDMKEDYSKNSVSNVNQEGESNSSNNQSENKSNSLTSTNNSSANEINKFSDTPQSQTTFSDSYLTNLTENKNEINTNNEATESQSTSINNTLNSNSTLKNKGEASETYVLKRKGNIGVMTSQDLIEKEIELRKKVTNIINKFLENECNCLFMGVY